MEKQGEINNMEKHRGVSNMEKILITGVNGFFASRFIDYYKEKYDIIGLSHNEMDITDENKTAAIIKQINPAYLVHAAAISDTDMCQNNPELSYNVNFIGSINIAKACKLTGAKLIYLSSDQVYNGNTESGPYHEDKPAIPNNVYGKHKLAAEDAIFEVLPESVALRLTWLFCLPEKNKKTSSNIIWNAVRQAMKNEIMTISINDYRGITYVYELIENLDKFFKLPGGAYNAGSENNLNSYEIMSLVFKELGLEHRIHDLRIEDTQNNKEHPQDLRICNNKLKHYDIYFKDTKEAINKCINDFLFRV